MLCLINCQSQHNLRLDCGGDISYQIFKKIFFVDDAINTVRPLEQRHSLIVTPTAAVAQSANRVRFPVAA